MTLLGNHVQGSDDLQVFDRGGGAPDDTSGRWRSLPWFARAIRLVAFLLPIAIAYLCAHVLSSRLPTVDSFWLSVVRWVAIAAVSTVVLVAIQRAARRLLPVAALYSLSLIFPDAAPSRFAIALRAGTTRDLQRQITYTPETLPESTPQESAEEMLRLVAALSKHDRLTRGHSERVRAYSRMLGEELGLDEDELDRLHWAGLLHDIGKIGVPQEILGKRGEISAEEFEVIKTHTVIGQHLAAGLQGWLGEATSAVWEHHERWEGGGYPTGVPASELPLSSRIVSVADAFDVMTSARSYKHATPASRARAELQRCAGSQFDPMVVRAMMNISLGKLWKAMGPLSWVAQLRLFPQQLTQGGVVVANSVSALVSLVLTFSAAGLPGATDGAHESPSSRAPAVTQPADPATTASPPTPSSPVTIPVVSTSPSTQPTTLPTTPPTTPVVSTAPVVTGPASSPTSPTPTSPVSSVAPATTAASPTTAVPSATTTLPPPLTRLGLGSSAPGNVSSQSSLPLASRTPLNASPLPNYDTDRNADAGLTLVRSAGSLSSPASDAVQRWRLSITSPIAVSTARLEAWFARSGGLPSDTIVVVAVGLYNCSADGSSCTRLADALVAFSASTTAFHGLAFELAPPAPVVLAAGRVLELRIAVPDGSAADVVVAYDSSTYPAALHLGSS